jgi:hypothetical protein
LRDSRTPHGTRAHVTDIGFTPVSVITLAIDTIGSIAAGTCPSGVAAA